MFYAIPNAIDIWIIYLDTYFKNDIGENCHADQIIGTENTCKDAAVVLGLTYLKSVNSQVDPAGCYWNHNRMAIYNQIVDPSQTYPEEFGVKGGVCMRYGKYQNNFKVTFKFFFYLFANFFVLFLNHLYYY